MKSGYQTSEFWLSFAAIVVGALLASGLLDEPGIPSWATKAVGFVGSVFVAMGYSMQRAKVKMATLKGETPEAPAEEVKP